MTTNSPILVILGPTASGKSALSLAIAQHTGAEILSLDSMQVYRAMDIGTAKPTPAEQAATKHHLINIVDPTESFTVAKFVELAAPVIASAAERGKPLIAAGGTPLYYKALFQGLFEGPATDPVLRQRLAEQSNEQLHHRLLAVDPAAANRIHMNDTRRLIRALEVFDLTGKPISSLQTAWDAPPSTYPTVWVGLKWDRELLNRRINARVKSMLAAGWLEETQNLLARFGSLSQTAGEATGYAELIAHLQRKSSLDDAIEQIKIATRQLARRQMKWFKRFPNVHWLNGEAPLAENVQAVLNLWPIAPAAQPG